MSPKWRNNCALINCSRMIYNAWYLYHASNLVFKVVCGGIDITLLTP
nr:DUF3265 domain-containing protein [Vibrio lentus]